MEKPVETMLSQQLLARGIHDKLVLDAMARVPRERFVLPEYRDRAYDDCPLPIGLGQTISQPYIVALMVQLAHIDPDACVLDIGTGCGYMAAVLAEIASEVCTLETIPELATMAQGHFRELGISNIEPQVGDGHLGWPRPRNFDAIIVSCAADQRPDTLLTQLKPGGRAIVPLSLSPGEQVLTIYEKQSDGTLKTTPHSAVRFVPMV